PPISAVGGVREWRHVGHDGEYRPRNCSPAGRRVPFVVSPLFRRHTPMAAEKMEFKTELKQLLHLITHSLYSNREIFLRELNSNDSDAINKIKFNSLQHDELLEENKDWSIRIVPDKDAKTLTIADNGIGMSREGIIDQLGTIAKSGTRVF